MSREAALPTSARDAYSAPIHRGARVVLKFRARVTLDHAIAAIAKRSAGVTWHKDSEGLALVLKTGGYALTARPENHQPETLPERVQIAREDGSPMGEGHKLTQRERERAVEAILRGGLERRIAGRPFDASSTPVLTYPALVRRAS